MNLDENNQDDFPDPREEQRYQDAEDLRYENMVVIAKTLVSNNTFLDELELICNRNVEVYDNTVEELLNDFPQSIIDKFKYKVEM